VNVDLAYRIRRPMRSDESALATLSRDIWPGARSDKLAQRWWWNDPVAPQCWIAEHRDTGAIAAICGERRSMLLVGHELVPTATICDWDVASAHKGRGLGRSLVEASAATHPVMYTTSISDSAAAAFARLGWRGDARVPILLGAPATIALLGLSRRGPDVRRFEVSADSASGLEHVEALWRSQTPMGLLVPRDAAFVRSHLNLVPHRRYELAVAFDREVVLGWMLARILPSGSLRRLRAGRVGVIADYYVRPDAPDALNALMGIVARTMTKRGCLGVATMTTNAKHARAFRAMGFVSAETPLIGRYLGSVSARCMHWSDRVLPSFSEGWHLTFADNDMDLTLGSAGE